MNRIEVGRYGNPQEVGYQGWVMPESDGQIPDWALFVTREGHVKLGVKGDDGELHFGE